MLHIALVAALSFYGQYHVGDELVLPADQVPSGAQLGRLEWRDVYREANRILDVFWRKGDVVPVAGGYWIGKRFEVRIDDRTNTIAIDFPRGMVTFDRNDGRCVSAFVPGRKPSNYQPSTDIGEARAKRYAKEYAKRLTQIEESTFSSIVNVFSNAYSLSLIPTYDGIPSRDGAAHFDIDVETGQLIQFAQSKLPKVRLPVRPVISEDEARQRVLDAGVAGKLGYKRMAWRKKHGELYLVVPVPGEGEWTMDESEIQAKQKGESIPVWTFLIDDLDSPLREGWHKHFAFVYVDAKTGRVFSVRKVKLEEMGG